MARPGFSPISAPALAGVAVWSLLAVTAGSSSARAQDALAAQDAPAAQDTPASQAPADLPPPDAPNKVDPRLLPVPEEVVDDDHSQDTSSTPLTVSIGTGYALRLQEDERFHGATGRFALDIPVIWGFGVRGEFDANAWGPAARAPRPLVLSYGALSLIYAVDEGPITGTLGVGAAAGLGVDVVDDQDANAATIASNNGLYAGALLSIGIRVRIGPTTHLELTGLLPVMLQEPTGLFFRAPFGTDRGGLFPFQPAVSVGLVFEPIAFTAGILRGEPVWTLVAPDALDALLGIFTL